MSPTINDVATRAGVSTATVSRFMAGEKVRSEAAVRRAVEELGYRPAMAARSLRSGIHYVVAVVVPDLTNPYFASVVKGVESVFRSTPYNVFVCNTDESPATEEQVLLETMHRVDGIILAPTTEQEDTPLQVLEQGQGVPLVFIDRELSGGELDSVLVDNIGGAKAAIDHLLALGHTDIAIISGPLNTTPGRGRYDGYLRALADAGLTPPESYRQIANFKESSGFEAMQRLLTLPGPPTAVFCANNLMTIGALKALQAGRVAFGEQVSVIGFDDLDMASMLNPPLTVIDRPNVEQGAIAARLLLKHFANGDKALERQRLVLPTQLIQRESCKPPRRKALIRSKNTEGAGSHGDGL